ncbi:SKP1-like protein 12 [Bidens hawaiensis]|uniref:SKP1-like protein 12 n=1 Tax=Bidens hawaiensis TaxID=980011 RepID=UPI00404B4C9A
MAKVLEYCNKYVYDDAARSNITTVDETRELDARFVDVHYETLFDLFRAANELKIKKLSDVVGGRIGRLMLGKSVEEIRIMFNINDSCVDHHPPQEELNAWAFH